MCKQCLFKSHWDLGASGDLDYVELYGATFCFVSDVMFTFSNKSPSTSLV